MPNDLLLLDIMPFDLSITVNLEEFAANPSRSDFESRLSFPIAALGSFRHVTFNSALHVSPETVGSNVPEGFAALHDSRQILAELDIAVIIQRRLRLMFEKGLREANNVISGSGGQDDLILYNEENGTLALRADVSSGFFDVRTFMNYGPSPFLFDVSGITLNSPTTIKGRFKTYASLTLAGCRLFVCEVGLEAPVAEVSKAQVALAADLFKQGLPAIGALGTGVTLYAHFDNKRQEAVDRLYDDLRGSDGGIALQQSLQTLGFYHGDIDGKIGHGTKKAATAFARSVGLPSTVSPTNSTFCRVLAEATIKAPTHWF